MEYQKIINLLAINQINHPNLEQKIGFESRGTYNTNNQIKFKTTILKSSLCNYSDACILVKESITVNNTAAEDADTNNANKKVIFKNCAPFTNCISEINNT